VASWLLAVVVELVLLVLVDNQGRVQAVVVLFYDVFSVSLPLFPFTICKAHSSASALLHKNVVKMEDDG